MPGCLPNHLRNRQRAPRGEPFLRAPLLAAPRSSRAAYCEAAVLIFLLKPIILPIFALVRRTVLRGHNLKLTFMKTSSQTSPAPGRYIDLMFDRVLYYGSLPILDQPDSGGEYALMPVYVISILDFSLEHEIWNGDVRSSYSIREDGTGELMSDALHFIFLELGRFNKKVTELANDKEKWYYCIRHMDKLTERPKPMQAEIFRRLFNVSEVEALPKQEREQYIREMNTERDIRNQKAFAREQGMAQGKAEGLVEGKLEVARAMLAKGMDISLVSELTGLTVEQLEHSS